MAIHVQDDEADWLLREFARKRGLGLTAAIKVAVREAGRKDEEDVEAFFSNIKPVIERARARKASLPTSSAIPSPNDKTFMDEMWGEAN